MYIHNPLPSLSLSLSLSTERRSQQITCLDRSSSARRLNGQYPFKSQEKQSRGQFKWTLHAHMAPLWVPFPALADRAQARKPSKGVGRRTSKIMKMNSWSMRTHTDAAK